jgi:hypothetical protein
MLTNMALLADCDDDQSLVKTAAAEITVVNAEGAYGNLTLPTVQRGAKVIWSSSHAKIVSVKSDVNRPKAHDRTFRGR